MAKKIIILGGDSIEQSVAENNLTWSYDANTDVGPIFPDQNITYTLSGADAAYFNIDKNGVITLKNAADYETKSSYDVVITATHVSGGKDMQELQLEVMNVNDNAPVITGAETAAVTIDENIAVVTTIKATDADGNLNPLTYSIVGGSDGDLFVIDPATGALSFKQSPDYENASHSNVYNVTVGVSDGTFSDTQDVTVTVNNVNDNAPIITGADTVAVSIDENIAAVTTIQATDADGNLNPLTYSIVGGVDAGLFHIDAATGTLSFKQEPDYENAAHANVYSVTVGVSDGTFSDTQDVTVTVNNVNDNAPILADVAAAVNENVAAGTVIAQLAATDADGNLNPITYSLAAGGTGDGLFEVAADGTVSVAAGVVLDYETAQSYTLNVQVSDGVHSDTAVITVNLNDVYEAPPVVAPATVDPTPAAPPSDTTIAATDGNVINATRGDDIIVGTEKNDIIHAKAGKDILVGIGGDDRLQGDAGADIFYFDATKNEGFDTIVDFSRLEGDKINIANADESMVSINQSGQDSVINIDGSLTMITVQKETITLDDITYSTLV